MKGRAAGIRCILVAQQNSVRVLPSLVQANVATRIALRMTSIANSNMAIGQRGAESLERPGEFIVRSPACQQVVRGCARWIPEIELRERVEGAGSHFEPLHLKLPAPSLASRAVHQAEKVAPEGVRPSGAKWDCRSVVPVIGSLLGRLARLAWLLLDTTLVGLEGGLHVLRHRLERLNGRYRRRRRRR